MTHLPHPVLALASLRLVLLGPGAAQRDPPGLPAAGWPVLYAWGRVPAWVRFRKASLGFRPLPPSPPKSFRGRSPVAAAFPRC